MFANGQVVKSIYTKFNYNKCEYKATLIVKDSKMTTIMLTRMVHYIGTIQNILQNLQCKCFVVNDLCSLEREARNNIFDFLLVDKQFLFDNEKVFILTESLGILNENIPIIFFDVENFKAYFASNTQNISQQSLYEITLLLENVQKNMHTYQNTSNTLLRPVEKRLYDLLKNTKEKSLSLEEMSLFLWGYTSSAHTKTLYSYIHRIKQILAENNQNIEWLVKEKKGCYKISSEFKETHENIIATIKQ